MLKIVVVFDVLVGWFLYLVLIVCRKMVVMFVKIVIFVFGLRFVGIGLIIGSVGMNVFVGNVKRFFVW